MSVEPKIVGFPPKSSILIGFSIINQPFWGTTIFGNTHINLVSVLAFSHFTRREVEKCLAFHSRFATVHAFIGSMNLLLRCIFQIWWVLVLIR